MPDEIVIDFSHPSPQPLQRPMADDDAAQLATDQAAAQAGAAVDDTRHQDIRTLLTAYEANSSPSGAETVAALKAVIRAIARDIPP